MKIPQRHVLSSSDSITAAFIYATAVITGFGGGAYKARGMEVPGALVLLGYLAFTSLLGYWVQKDTGRSGVWHVFDLGFLMYLLWPVMVPYYLLKTRGAKGLLPVLWFVGTYVAAFVLTFTVVGLSS